jgi:hypothetical protein
MYSWLRKKKGANEKSKIFLMGVMGRLAATKTYQKAARFGSNQEKATLDSKLLKKQQTKEPYAKSKIGFSSLHQQMLRLKLFFLLSRRKKTKECVFLFWLMEKEKKI